MALLIQTALSPATRAAYLVGWRQFVWFCAQLGSPDPFAASAATVCFFVVWVTMRGSVESASTVSSYVTHVRSNFLDAGVPFPESRTLRKLLKAAKRVLRTSPLPRQPVTVDVLRAIRPFIDLSDPAGATMWALCVSATFGLFRLGELCQTPHGPSPPTFASLVPSRDGSHVAIFLQRSKTDQDGVGVTVPLCPSGDFVCPVIAIALHTAAQHALFPGGIPLAAPLFPDPLDPSKPYSTVRFIENFRALISRAGLDPLRFSGHSFRRGGAQDLLDAGCSVAEVMMMGRWRSEAWQRYVVLPAAHRTALARRMAAHANPRAADLDALPRELPDFT